MGGFEVLEVPGHSPAALAFWREGDRVLVCGDVVANFGLHPSRPRLVLVPAALSWDAATNRRSAGRLAELRPRLACFGHGFVVSDPGRFAAAVQQAAAASSQVRADSSLARGRDGIAVIQDHWERHATDWIRWARTPGHDIWYWRLNRPWFLELLPPPGRLTVDLGCGEGRLLRELAAMGHRVVGVDSAPTMARAAAQALGSDAGVVVADAARLPFASGAADLVVAFMSLLNVDDLPAAVGEVSRVLAPGGRLCMALLHPIASAGTFLQDDADARFVLTRSYFEPSCEPQLFKRGRLSMTFLDRHLPLEAYFLALQAAGLVVEALREPRPDDAAVGDHPAMGRRRRVPLFLHLRAVKPITGSSGPA